MTAMAKSLRPDQREGLGEMRHLQPGVRAALKLAFGESAVGKEWSPQGGFPDWSPTPRGVDAAVLDPATENALIGIELKVDKVDESLWDILKMASLRRVNRVEAAYVAVAAATTSWSGSSDCAALFTGDPDDDKEWHTAYFFEQWPRAWKRLLAGGSGRPTRIPTRLYLPLVAVLPFMGFPGYELRILRVENTSYAPWLLFGESGWPDGRRDPDYPRSYPLQIQDDELKVDDLPTAERDDDAYYCNHRSARNGRGHEALPSGDDSVRRRFRRPASGRVPAPLPIAGGDAALRPRAVSVTLQARGRRRSGAFLAPARPTGMRVS
jgi:hypothetical protein